MSEWIKSPYCDACGGQGFEWLRHENALADNEKEQCESCEGLNRMFQEIDRKYDEAKGN